MNIPCFELSRTSERSPRTGVWTFRIVVQYQRERERESKVALSEGVG
jgi:hypothetical protein